MHYDPDWPLCEGILEDGSACSGRIFRNAHGSKSGLCLDCIGGIERGETIKRHTENPRPKSSAANQWTSKVAKKVSDDVMLFGEDMTPLLKSAELDDEERILKEKEEALKQEKAELQAKRLKLESNRKAIIEFITKASIEKTEAVLAFMNTL
jgi:hypothetical protein